MMSFRFCSGVLAILLVCVTSVSAEAPTPFPDFSAKRVKPPKPGQGPKIDVQISPEDPKFVTPVSPNKADGDEAPSSRYEWFWETTSPLISDSGPGRLSPALVSLGNPPQGKGVAAPRLQDMHNIARAHGVDILRATVGTQVSPALVLAVIAVESGGNSDAVSGAGAQGLMQLMPITAERFGVDDAMVAQDNIEGGVAFLDLLMENFERDPILVLAGYNAGENSVRSHNGVPPFAETRDYVPKVLAAFTVARGICKTPPELISDGCVFALN